MTATASSRPWHWQRWHFIVLLLGVAVRVGYALSVNREDAFAVWDGREYYSFAKNLLAFQGDDYPRFFNFYRAPGYPLFLIPFVAIDPAHLWPIQLFQAFLGALLPCLLGAIAARWAGQRAGDWAFALAMFHPFLIFYCGFLFTETLFMALLWLGILCFQRLQKAKSAGTDAPADTDLWRWTSRGGVVFGLACLVRPALQPFLVVAVFWLGLQILRGRDFRIAVSAATGFTVIVSSILLPWQLGNLWAHGEFSLGPFYGKAVYLQSNSREFVDMYEAKTKDEYYAIFSRSADSLSIKKGMSPAQWMDEARAFRRDHRDLWWRLQYYKIIHFWRPWLNPLIFSRAHVLLSGLVTVPLFLGAGLELWHRRRAWDSFLSLLVSLVAVGFAIGGLLFVASVRYRIPLVDVTFLVLTAAWLGRQSWLVWPREKSA